MIESRLTEITQIFKTFRQAEEELFQEILRIARIMELDNSLCIHELISNTDRIYLLEKGFLYKRVDNQDGYTDSFSTSAEWFIPFEWFSLLDVELDRIRFNLMMTKEKEELIRSLENLKKDIEFKQKRVAELEKALSTGYEKGK